MGKKGLTSIFSRFVDSGGPVAFDGNSAPPPPWPWPSCRNPQTASFREVDRACSTTADADGTNVRRSPAADAMLRSGVGEMFKTVNSVYQMDFSVDGSCFDEEEERVVVVEDDDDGFSTTTACEEWSEAVIRSLGRTSTDRFFVEPGPESNSILALSPGKPASAPEDFKVAVVSEEASPSEASSTTSLVEESVAVAVDSEDPYRDFRASMEEMVSAHGLRGWEALEELLVWYLRINGKHNHALIVGAFVDLIVGLATPLPCSAAPTTTTMTTTSSSGSTATTDSTSTSNSTCGRDAAGATPTTASADQCGGENDASSHCSSASSSQEESVAADEAAGDDHGISTTLLHDRGSAALLTARINSKNNKSSVVVYSAGLG